MTRHVYIYNDEGSSEESVQGWVQALSQEAHHRHEQITLSNADELPHHLTRQSAQRTTLLMPGGFDSGFQRRIKPQTISLIRSLVSAGATYLASCAGAYFASSKCVFEPHDSLLRVVEERPLRLFPQAAFGAIRPHFAYNSEAGATLERIQVCYDGNSFPAALYCNGAPAWDIARDGDYDEQVVARYEEAVLRRHGLANESPAAVVAAPFGSGVAVLSGVHAELPMGGELGRRELLHVLLRAARLR
ncbi:Biotin--protein ligase [Gracilariopsis chorda]|uniref:Biotin--protein ligase n=1 Tax=Gracilariopsis chorda TaxID=448386 RepID=A0A2V3J419_9FLOR|nr:Biotin--protein ligase [Gracilariopsis chorda]|eukprot:PXF49135.1 Biotin--protein ligase [Gracilariopsis chorda]